MNTCYSVQTDLAEGQNIALLKLSLFTQTLKLNFGRNRTSNQSSISASVFHQSYQLLERRFVSKMSKCAMFGKE